MLAPGFPASKQQEVNCASMRRFFSLTLAAPLCVAALTPRSGAKPSNDELSDDDLKAIAGGRKQRAAGWDLNSLLDYSQVG